MNTQTQTTNTTTNTNEPTNTFNGAKFIAECGTKSSAIRRLNEQNFSRGEIAKMLKIKYQHVRNVLITPIKKELVRK